MTHGRVVVMLLVFGLVAVSAPTMAQEIPETAWGAPDLQGVWDFRTITPLERPEDLGDQEFLTEEEAANLEQEAVDRNERLDNEAAQRTESGGNIGAYNNFWFDRGTNSVGDRRTALIVDPLNGRLPDVTDAGQTRRAGGRGSFSDELPASYTDLSNADRCIMGFNAGPPMTPGAYNNNMQLFQTPEHVAIVTEMVHTARIIPLRKRAEQGDRIRQWSGDSHGYWEGETLVIETDNFNDHNVYNTWRGSTKNMKLVERFTRVDADTLLYEFTVNDLETWTSPWTAQVPMQRNELSLFEYACHEGNYSMEAMLGGARADERKAIAGGGQ